jgi:hypothetical protein
VYNGKPLVSVILLLVAGAITVAAPAADLKVTMYKVTANRVGESMGTIEFRDSSDFGVLIIPKLHGLTPGLHGFHMHQNPACEPQVKDGKPVAITTPPTPDATKDLWVMVIWVISRRCSPIRKETHRWPCLRRACRFPTWWGARSWSTLTVTTIPTSRNRWEEAVRAWRAVWSAWSRRIDRDSQRPVPGVTTFLPKFNRVETLDSGTVHWTCARRPAVRQGLQLRAGNRRGKHLKR